MVYLIFWVFFFGLFCRRSLSFVSRRVLRVGGTATLELSPTRQRGCQSKSDSMYVTVTLEEKYNDIREIFDTIYLFCIFTSLSLFIIIYSVLSLSLSLSPPPPRLVVPVFSRQQCMRSFLAVFLDSCQHQLPR